MPASEYRPLFPSKGQTAVAVAPFALERTPVTHAQFLAFVAAMPEWRRSRVPSLFADSGYLADWAEDLSPPPDATERPVTAVSWFAARAYARWRGRRLPTLAEWEAAAQLPLADGGNAARAVLAWYAKPASSGPQRLGTGTRNVLGIADLHGLVWEWVLDFGGAMVTGDARSDSDLQRSLFCGAGAVGSARPDDYAAFMRMAMRSSLHGRNSTKTLGFRCATDQIPGAR
ncbi:MAG: formylglycine-generating enzyme family protein [Planctomycetes bacterium]|nr:formylglycine-generating enzyme family protein [Planctomycetota bacterium]